MVQSSMFPGGRSGVLRRCSHSARAMARSSIMSPRMALFMSMFMSPAMKVNLGL